MTKFHIAANGRTEPCTATKRACPRGGAEAHFDSIQEALIVTHEALMRDQTKSQLVEDDFDPISRYRRLAQAKARFLEEEGDLHGFTERLAASEKAPEDLRPFFFSKPPFRTPEGTLFNSHRAVEVLAREEHLAPGESMNDSFREAMLARRGHPERPDGQPPLTKGLEQLADPSFTDDLFWRESDERKMLTRHLPKTLERLERQLTRTAR